MEQLLNDNAWFIYPTNSNEVLMMTITFSNSPKNNNIINKLINNYLGELENCSIGNHTIMITIKNIYVLQLLSDVYSKDNIEYIKYPIYEDYMEIYKNQEKYFKGVYLL